MVQNRLSNEFLLVAACCEWPRTDARDQRLKELGACVSWDQVSRLAKRHRVEGHVHRALTEAAIEIGEPARNALARGATAIGTQSLLQSAESARLQRLLSERQVECIFLKGVALSMLAYGGLGVKQAWDIDVLVSPADVAEAISVLREAGYTRSYPEDEVPDERLLAWTEVSKETLWLHQRNGMVVELHTGLVDHPGLLSEVVARPARQRVQIGPGVELTTLRTDQLIAYLCVHGAWHAWARLKWLADVAALIRRQPPSEIEFVYRSCVALGAGRSAAQAMLLCSDLLSLALPEQLEAELRRDPANRWLQELALRAMSQHGAVELDHTVFGTVVINLSHFLLGRGWRYKYGVIARKTSNPEDRFGMPLPRYAHFLYPMLAVPRWIWRRYRLSRS